MVQDQQAGQMQPGGGAKPLPRIPLVVATSNRGESTSFDARIVNAYVEKSPDGQLWVVKRPGTTVQNALGAATGRGTYNWQGHVYSIFGATLYKDTTPIVGTVDTTAGVYSFSSCLGATPKLFLQNGVAAYTYDAVGGLVHVTDVHYPTTTVKGSAYLDGTTYVMDALANIYGNSINDPQTWSASNLIKAQIEPDGGVYLAKQLVYVIALKQWSTEVFYDAGNATGSPLTSVQGAKFGYGCRHQDTVQDMDGVLYWVSATRSGTVGVMMMENLKAQPIATQPIVRLLQNADFTSVLSWTLAMDGHKFYGITLVNSNLTLVFDVSTGEWQQWTDPNGNYIPWCGSTYSLTQQPLLQDIADGDIYVASSTTYTDQGITIPVDVYTPNYDGDVNKGKTVNKLYIIADRTLGSNIQVRVSDEDYKHWSNPVTVDLSVEKPYIPDMGTFTRRAHHIHHRCNTALRLKALELHALIGTL